MLGGFFMFVNIENMEKPKCAEIFWQMQKQFRLTTMIYSIFFFNTVKPRHSGPRHSGFLVTTDLNIIHFFY